MGQHFRICPQMGANLIQRGVPIPAVLRSAGLPANFFQQEQVQVTTEQLFALWGSLAEHCDDPAIGLWLGSTMAAERYEPTAIAALSSSCFADALERIARYKKLKCPEEIRIATRGQEVSVEFNFLLGGSLEPRLLIDLCFAWIWNIGLQGTGQAMTPLRVELARPATHAQVVSSHFGCPVRFNAPRNQLVMHLEDVQRRFTTHNPLLLSMLGTQLDSELAASRAPLGDQVKTTLKQILAGQRPRLEAVASQLGTSPRTLQRRLTAGGWTFQTLLEQARRELARHYLTHSQLELRELAYLLGYDDCNSFIRAFQSWEGSPPGQWRQHHRLASVG